MSIDTAKASLAEAQDLHRKALDRLREHDSLTDRVQNELEGLSERARESLSASDGGQAWRAQRASLVSEVDGLRLQRTYLAKDVTDLSEEVTRLQRIVSDLEAEETRVRLMQAEAQLKPAVTEIVKAWALHCAVYGGLRDDRSGLAAWLLAPDGLFPLAGLLREDAAIPSPE